MAGDLQGTAADLESASLPQFEEAMFDGVVAAMAGSGSIDDALASLRDAVRDKIAKDGQSDGDAEAAADAFMAGFQEQIFQFDADPLEARDYGSSAMKVVISGANEAPPLDGVGGPLSAEEQAVADLITALARGGDFSKELDGVIEATGGAGGDIEAVKQAIEGEIQEALADGVSPQQVARQAADSAESAMGTKTDQSVPVENELIGALSGNGDVDKALSKAADEAGGDAASFMSNLENALADKTDADTALDQAGQAARDTQQAKDGSKVELSPQEQLAQSLAEGGDKANEALDQIGGDETFANTLGQSLADGSDTGTAFDQANQAQQNADAAARSQTVEMTPAQQFAASLAEGNQEAVQQAIEQGGDAFANTVEQGLASGQTPDSAVAQGQQAQQNQQQVEADQSVPLTPAQQMAADMAAGNTEAVDQAVANGGDAFADEMEANLAAGTSPDQAASQAQSAQQSADNTASDQSVPADPAATALAQGGDATDGVDLAAAVQDATGTTGGESDSSQTQTQTAETTSTETTSTETTSTGTTSTETTGAETTGTDSTTETTTTASTESSDGTGTGSTESTETTQTADAADSTAATGSTETTSTTETTDTSTSTDGGETEDTTQTAATSTQEAGDGTGATETGDGTQTTETETTETGTEQTGDETQTAQAGETGNGTTPEDGSTDTGATDQGKPGEEVTEGIQTAGDTPQGNDAGDETGEETAEDGDGQGQGQGQGQGDGTQVASNQPVTGEGGGGDQPTEEEIEALQNIATAAGGQGGQGGQGNSNLNMGDFLNPGSFGGGNTGPTGGGAGATGGTGGSGDTGGSRGGRTETTETGGGTTTETTVDAAPTTQGASLSNNEDATASNANGTITFDLTTVTSDDNTGVTYAETSSLPADQGTFNISPAGLLTFEPGANFNYLAVQEKATITIGYRATDSANQSVDGTVTITLDGVNDAPVVTGQITEGAVSEDADAVKVIDLLKNASDPDTSDVKKTDSVVVTSSDGRDVDFDIDNDTGLLTIDPGQFSYLPRGIDIVITVEYNVVDSNGGSVATSATMEVNGANDGPVIVTPLDLADVTEDTDPIEIRLLDGVSDDDEGHDLDTASVTVTSSDFRPVAFEIDDETGILKIDPSQFEDLGAGGFVDLTVNYNVVDDTGASIPTSAGFTVNGSNDAPTISTGTALNLAAANSSYVDIPDTVVNNMSAGAIEAWVYFDGTATGAIFTKQHNNVNSHAILRVEDGTVHWNSHNNAGPLSSNTAITADAWHHIAISFSDTGAEMFINGNSVGVEADNFSILDDSSINNASGGSAIGGWLAHGGGLHWDGQIAEFRVWDTTLDEAAVQANMNTALTGGEPNLRALYNFDAPIADGGIVTDAAGGADGTSSNAVSGAAVAGYPGGGTAQVGDEDTTIAVSNVTVDDVEGDSLTVTLTAGDGGTLNANQNGGTATIGGEGTGVMTISGNPAEVNAALESLTYTPVANFNGATSIAIAVSDGAVTTNDTVDITVNAVNDPIVISENRVVDFEGLGSNGTDSSFSLGIAAGLTDFPTDAFTIEFDIKTTDTDFVAFSYAVASGNRDNEIGVFHDGAGLDLWVGDTEVLSNIDIGILDDDWHHFAVTFDNAGGTGTVYVDGAEVAEFVPGGPIEAGGTLVIGNDQEVVGGDFKQADAFTGQMDNVRVWSEARSDAEIAANAGNTVDSENEASLVYDWRMDETSGNIANAANPDGPEMVLQNASTEGRGDATTIVTEEDFEGGPDADWSVSTTETLTGLTQVLGRFGSGGSAEKSFTIPGIAEGARITFDFHALDSWDAETFTVTMNGTSVASNTFTHGVDGSGGGFVLTQGPSDFTASGGWPDATYAVTIDVSAAQLAALPDDGNGNKVMTLNFSSNLDSPIADESWAIDNLAIEANGSTSEEFSTLADTIVIDLLDNVSGGEADLDVANVTITASDARDVKFTVDNETGMVTIDSAQFDDLESQSETVSLSISYDVTDGTQTESTTTVVAVNGADGPRLIGTTGHDTIVALDGLDDQLSIAHSADINFGGTQPFTVEMWINPSDKAGLQTLFDKTELAGGDDPATRLHYIDGRLTSWNPLGGNIETTGVNIPANEWTHIAYSYDGANLKMVVNGVEANLTYTNGGAVEGTNVAYTLGNANTDSFIIGDDNQAGRNFEGEIAEVKIWNASRTTEQILDGMTTPVDDPANEPNLVGYYTFEDGTGTDASGSGNDVNLDNGAAPILETGDALVLGANQNGQTITEDVDIDGSFSVEVFVATTDADKAILSHEQNAFSQPHFQIALTASGQIQLYLREGTDNASSGALKNYIGTTVINTGVEHHIAVTFDDDTDQLQLYVNGALETVTVNSDWGAAGTYSRTDVSDPHGLRLGTNEKNDAGQRFEGEIGELRVWNEALTADEVQHNAFNPVGSADDGLQHLWTFANGELDDQIQGNRILAGSDTAVGSDDLGLGAAEVETSQGMTVSGQLLADTTVGGSVTFAQETGPSNGSLQLSATGDYTYIPNNAFRGTDSFQVRMTDASNNTRVETVTVIVNDPPVVSEHANSLVLDGSTYVSVADDVTLDVSNTFTLELWVKADTSGTLISKDELGTDTTGAYNLALTDDGLGGFNLIYETNNSHPNVSATSALNAGEWHHVAATFSNGDVSLYVDGASVATGTGVPAPSVLSTDLLIGRRGLDADPDYLTGQIDDVRVWDTALDSNAIAGNLTQELTGEESGLAGYWTFNEASGATVVDQTANANDGTITGNEARSQMVDVSISSNDVYHGLLLGGDENGDQLSYRIASDPSHGTVTLDGNKFVYDHNGTGDRDTFTVEISDGLDTVTEEIDVTVV